MLARPRLLPSLQQHIRAPDGTALCIYGDPVYPLRQQLQNPFRGSHENDQQQLWNKAMSKARISVVQAFEDIINYFKFLKFYRNLKIQLNAVENVYSLCHVTKCSILVL